MNDRQNLEPTLRAWFEGDGRGAAPKELLDAVTIATRSRRPYPRWIASLRGSGLGPAARTTGPSLRPTLRLAIVCLVFLAAIAGAVVGVGSLPSLLSNAPTPIALSPTPGASLAAATLRPIVSVPSGLVSVRTVSEVEQMARELIEAGQLGIASEPTRVTRVTLVPVGGVYHFAADGAQTMDFQSWVVEVQGTIVWCGFSCERWQTPTLLIGDVDGSIGPTGEHDGTKMPSTPFRQLLADHGLVYTPAAAPSAGIVADDIKPRLDTDDFWTGYPLNGPMYGLIWVASPDLASERVIAITPEGDGTKAIWWVGARDQIFPEKAPWAVFDASTGDLLVARSR